MSQVKPLYIGGYWRAGSGRVLSSVNPATNETIAEVSTADASDVDVAVEAGRVAMNQPEWRQMLPHLRARLLYRIGDLIEADADAISQLQTLDTGKTLRETRALALSAAGTFRYVAAALETLEGALTPPRGDFLTMSIHEPMGVIAGITPWNSPIASDAQKLAPALAAGNAVILKPAEWTPLVSLKLAELCEQAGLPAGLLSVLVGPGSVVGEALVRHRDVKKVSFTGGTSTGRRLAATAGEKLMPVSLELGGKSPVIVMADADIDHAINGVLFGIFSSTGQSCIAGSRLFVHASIYETFVERLVARTSALRVGLPTDAGTQVSSLVHARHRDSVATYVELARQEGGTILCGGTTPSDPALSRGAYYLPTIIAGLSNSARTCQEEIFGPVLVVMPYTDEDTFIQDANDSVYGLACGIWTRDAAKAYKLARAVEAGTVWINTYKQFSISTPFGGVKDSGLGREKGRLGILEYCQQKSLYWGLNAEPLAWAN